LGSVIYEEACLKTVTRREFFSHICSSDAVKGILGAWYGFNGEVNKANKLTCEEAGMMLGKRAKRKLSKFYEINRKEG
jgi:hypothetical protein